jgi:DNA-binding NarL/FixJ family response regulator
MPAIRLLIVDSKDQYWKDAEPDFASDPRFEQVSRAVSSEQALMKLHSIRPSVAIVDMTVPSPATSELLHRLSTTTSPVPVVAICEPLDDGHVGYAVGAGACAVLSSVSPPRQVRGIVLEVSAGAMPIQRDIAERPDLLKHLISEFQRRLRGTGPAQNNQCPLTERERSILDLVASGHANKEIASELGISERTVKNHMTNILAKLSARDRAHAVRIGIQNSWICRDRWEPMPVSRTAPNLVARAA